MFSRDGNSWRDVTSPQWAAADNIIDCLDEILRAGWGHLRLADFRHNDKPVIEARGRQTNTKSYWQLPFEPIDIELEVLRILSTSPVEFVFGEKP